MTNLNEFIKSIGGIVVVGCIFILGGGLAAYSIKKTVDEFKKDGYNPMVFSTTDPLEKGYERKETIGGTRRKKNKSRKK